LLKQNSGMTKDMNQKQPKILTDKDSWILAEDIPDIDFQFSQIWLSSFVNNLEKACGKNYKKDLCVYRGYNLKFYYGEKDSDDFAKHLLKKITKSPAYGKLINKNIRKYSDVLKRASRDIEPKKLRRLSNRELANFYHKLDELHTTLYSWGWLPNAVDMFHGNLTNYLKSILAKKASEDQVNEVLVTLSTFPEKSFIQIEHESFLNLVALKQKKASPRTLHNAILKHLDRFFYLKHLWTGKEVYTYKYYLREISRFIKSGENAVEMLKKENLVFKRTIAERKRLMKALKLTKRQKDLFDVYAEFAVTKAYRRDAQLYWAYKMDFMFSELSKRLGLTFMQSRFLFPWEVARGLTEGLDKDFKKEVRQRTEFCVTYSEKGKDLIFYGSEAKQIEDKLIQHHDGDIAEISGQTACLGKAKGKVKIINSPSDTRKMQQGDILVSIATNPDIVPAMKKAAAIVTEQGGITSHAAIVSRELGIPCIIGTKIATKVLKDGDLVEVDANKGIIRKIK